MGSRSMARRDDPFRGERGKKRDDDDDDDESFRITW